MAIDVSELTSAELYALMRDHYAGEVVGETLEIAAEAWARRSDGEPLDGDDLAELGECWRMAMLAATRLDVSPERLVWRVRAMSAFVRSGCRNGAALLCLPSFFDAAKDDRTTPEQVLAILDTMAMLADDNGPEPRSIVVSSTEEKRAYYLCVQAESATDPDERATGFEASREAYRVARSLERSPRRKVKLDAGATTTEYLAAGKGEGRAVAAKNLHALVDRIDAEGIAAVDVRRIAVTNLERMAAGRRDLISYEIT